ncbi:lymphocyte cytosolic protein 2-like [Acipenser ruthenus]|uniref:lymphocyte cytosolic protein 2-like n=1 Tax=Acipenser ruthenus TaxID=7906 RepID=UPI0027405B91|nr:lymphocyte cytosolic protein 2-like [Acipenser ruthenus]
MSFGNVPSRSEVMHWNASKLSDYLKSLNIKDCDKVVKKHNINGSRFLEMSDSDMQKFPKLHTPLISRLSHEINRKEEKRGFFNKKPTVHKIQEPEFSQDHASGWDSEEFDEDDYESPDAEDDVASGGDYESPNDDVPEQGESDNDYEPPPSDPPEDHQSKILPAKAICNNSDYIDNRNRASSVRTLPGQPPVPPQRPGATLPLPSSRGSMSSPLPPKCEERGYKPPKPGLPGAPSVDRTRKPTTMERSLPGLPERGSPKQGRKPPFGDKSLAQPRRPPSAEKPPDLHRMAKPPMPIDRNDSAMGRRQPVSRPWAQDRKDEPQDDSALMRPPIPQPGSSPFNSNTFPLRSKGLPPKPGPISSNNHNDSLPPGGSLPSRLQSAININRSPSRGPSDARPPLPPPQSQQPAMAPAPSLTHDEGLDPHWYVASITRPDAEDCLRNVNEDGAFLVRDSSKQSAVQPFVLMVLYKNKVFNIQIRYQEEQNVYLLGTGFKGKDNFSSVSEIIDYHMQTPLLLIDGKNRSSGQKSQCRLSYPAGYK